MTDGIILLGGTGFIGANLYQYLIANNFHNVIQFNHMQYDASILTYNQLLLEYLQNNNIRNIVDFTRTKKCHILSQKLLLSKLNRNITYVNISSYAVKYNDMFLDSYEYTYSKIAAEKNIRKYDYNIRLPRVVKSINDELIQQLQADKDIKYNYIYVNTVDNVVKNIVDILNFNLPGTYTVNSIKLVFK